MHDLSFDLRYLRCAIIAAELGSLRRAATALELSQSTVTRRIQLLERRLGFLLFFRDRRGVKLTIAGDDFLRDAVISARQLNRAAHMASAIHRGERGELRVGILASLTTGFLHCVLRRFKEEHPRLHITLREGTPYDALHGLAMGELDISFISGRPELAGCTSKVLWNESIYAVLPKGHRCAADEIIIWDDIRSEVFVVSRTGSGVELQDYLIQMLAQPGFRPRIDVHDVSRESLFSLVAIGYGITLTSTSSLGSEAAGVIFRPVAGGADVLPSSAVWPATNANPALHHLLSIAEGVARDWESRVARVAGGVADPCLLLRPPEKVALVGLGQRFARPI